MLYNPTHCNLIEITGNSNDENREKCLQSNANPI